MNGRYGYKFELLNGSLVLKNKGEGASSSVSERGVE